MFVRKSKDDTVILGTNALSKLNMVLKSNEKQDQLRGPHFKSGAEPSRPKQRVRFKEPEASSTDTNAAIVVRRVSIPPTQTKGVLSSRPKTNAGGVLRSNSELIPDVACGSNEPNVEILATNTGQTPNVSRVEDNIPLRDEMKSLEQPFSIGEKVYMRTSAERPGSKQPKWVSKWNRPFRITELTENSAVIKPVAANAEPLKVQCDFLKRLPIGMDNEPIRTAKQRRKRGRPKKSSRPHNESICFRIEAGLPQEDPRYLSHTCDCRISPTKTQTTLLSLCDRRKEEELMTKESKLLKTLEPARGIEAKVTDSYGTINDSVPLGHPAKCMGTSPRRGDAKVHPWQVTVFLSQVRKFALSTLAVTTANIFRYNKATEANDDEPQCDQYKQSAGPSKRPIKTAKPSVLHLHDDKKERQRHAHLKRQQFKWK
ncbi:unnamed protein product [Heligmosomoides polygyrus]|uniref:Uncharacterized protein n=1 Tax=Heligmosomoides polygyrus TaxID=6339 RepID=A0A183FBI5_HELPZ|nr:unnamed protein product [Heligmosomoides polygyrus]